MTGSPSHLIIRPWLESCFPIPTAEQLPSHPFPPRSSACGTGLQTGSPGQEGSAAASALQPLCYVPEDHLQHSSSILAGEARPTDLHALLKCRVCIFKGNGRQQHWSNHQELFL